LTIDQHLDEVPEPSTIVLNLSFASVLASLAPKKILFMKKKKQVPEKLDWIHFLLLRRVLKCFVL